MSFHTFPENNIISFDFFTCGKISPAVAVDIIKKEIEHKRIVKKEFNRDTISLYHDIYSSAGLKKSYVVNNVLEDFTSKVGQHIEILDLEQFGKSLFIDNEIQVATSDEHLYSSTFVNSGLKLNKDKEKAAIIGGGDGGVARECISKGFNFIDWYELDPEVVEVCNKHLGKIGNKATEKNSVKCIWGDAFESIKKVEDDKYDKIFVDLNDDQFCIDLAAKNMDSLVRILKPNGVITAQVGSYDKKPKQVEKWLDVFNKNFGNTTLDRVYIPSFDCSWNFSSSINH
jgi:spermidine synthase